MKQYLKKILLGIIFSRHSFALLRERRKILSNSVFKEAKTNLIRHKPKNPSTIFLVSYLYDTISISFCWNLPPSSSRLAIIPPPSLSLMHNVHASLISKIKVGSSTPLATSSKYQTPLPFSWIFMKTGGGGGTQFSMGRKTFSY